MFDATGVRFDFTVTEGIAEVISLCFRNAGDAGAVDLSGATFSAKGTSRASGESVALGVEHGVETGCLLLSVPALDAGAVDYEIFAVDDEGGAERVLWGGLTAVTSRHAEALVHDARKMPQRTLVLTAPRQVSSHWELRWAASSVAEQAAQRAEQAASELDGAMEEVRDAAQKLDGLDDKIAVVEATLARVQNQIMSAVVPNPETNTWWICGQDTFVRVTGQPGKSPKLSTSETWMLWDEDQEIWVDTLVPARGQDGRSPYVGQQGTWIVWDALAGAWSDTGLQAAGKDGLDGDKVRRILIDSVSQLPDEGETCHGGVYYYVEAYDALPVLLITVKAEGRTSSDRLVIRDVSVTLPEASLSAEEAASQLADALRQVFPDAEVQVEGATVSIRSDVQGWTVEQFNAEGYELAQHVRMIHAGYDVYAWLEHGGSAGWVRIGEAYDIATQELYGLVRLGSDVPVQSGAPVGVTDGGNLAVPLAGVAEPGVALPSLDTLVADGAGGKVGIDASGRLWADKSSSAQFGVVKLSFPELVESGCIGLRADGAISVAWATLTQAGCVRLGSKFGQLNPIPFQVGVGATSEHKLANNLLYGGALQHRQPAGWMSGDVMPWLSQSAEESPDYYRESDYYLGLRSSTQFRQSADHGLELLSADGSLLGGVYVASSMEDGRGNAVPTAAQVTGHLQEHYYTKAELYTRSESDERYATKAFVEQGFATKQELRDVDEAAVHKTDSWEGDVVMTEEAYNQLSEVNPKVKYYLI